MLPLGWNMSLVVGYTALLALSPAKTDMCAPEPSSPMRRSSRRRGTLAVNERVLTVSTSEIHTLGRCKRLYRYEYVDGRRPALQKHDMVWGGALHRGLEGWFRILARFENNDITPREKVNEWGLQRAIADALEPGEDEKGRPYQPPTDPYARAALRAILRAYVEYWWTDASVYEVVAVELPFLLPVRTARGRLVKGRVCPSCMGKGWAGKVDDYHDCPICHGAGKLRPMREGKIDLVVRTLVEQMGIPAGRVLVRETKSTTFDPTSDAYYTGIERDLQTALYFDAAREIGLDPAGVMYDVIRRPLYDEPKPPSAVKKDGTPRAQKKDVSYSNPRHGESPAAYEERIYQLATGEETRGTWFGRRMLPISEAQVREARATTHAAVDEIRWMAKTGHYPMVENRYVCAPPRKGGNGGVCPWLDVCDGRVVEGSGDYERLYPLKVKREDGETT
jgi:hypothetical protein